MFLRNANGPTTQPWESTNNISDAVIEWTEYSNNEVLNILDLNRMVTEIERKLHSWEEISDIKRDDEYPKAHWWDLKIQFSISKKEYTLLLKWSVKWKLDEEKTQELWHNVYTKAENFASLQFWEDECEVDNHSIIINSLNEAANKNWYDGNLYVYMIQRDWTIATSYRNNL